MNSTVEPTFNESFGKNRGLWVLWTMHRTHKPDRNALLKKKKEKKKGKT